MHPFYPRLTFAGFLMATTHLSLSLSAGTNSNARGYERLLEMVKVDDCSVTEEQVASMLPELSEDFPGNYREFCSKEGAESISQGSELTGLCEAASAKKAGRSLAQADKEEGWKDTAKKPRLNRIAKARFDEWKRTRICLKEGKDLKEAVSFAYMEAEEVCRSKGLAALPPYEIFRRARDQSAYSEGGACVPGDGVTCIYSEDIRDMAGNELAREKIAKGVREEKEIRGNEKLTTTVTGGGNFEAGLKGMASTAAHLGGSQTTSKDVGSLSLAKSIGRDYETYRKIGYNNPETMGYKPNFECKDGKCRNVSTNVWFPKSQLPQRTGCKIDVNCQPNPNFDAEAQRLGCVDEELRKYYDEEGVKRYGQDPFLVSDPEEQLEQGTCDENHFGKDFCARWQADQLSRFVGDVKTEFKTQREEAMKNVRRSGDCDSRILGREFCNDVAQEKVKVKREERSENAVPASGRISCSAGVSEERCDLLNSLIRLEPCQGNACPIEGSEGPTGLPEACRGEINHAAIKGISFGTIDIKPRSANAAFCKEAIDALRVDKLDIKGLDAYLKIGKCDNKFDPLCKVPGYSNSSDSP